MENIDQHVTGNYGEDQFTWTEKENVEEETTGYIGTPELRTIVNEESSRAYQLYCIAGAWEDSHQASDFVRQQISAAHTLLSEAHRALCEYEDGERVAAKSSVSLGEFHQSDFWASFVAGQEYQLNPNIHARARELNVGD